MRTIVTFARLSLVNEGSRLCSREAHCQVSPEQQVCIM